MVVILTRRKVLLLALDAILLTFAYIAAFWLRLDASGLQAQLPTIAKTLPILLPISLVVHLRHGLFNAILRYAGLETAVAVFKSTFWSVTTACLVIFLLFRLEGVPRSVFLIYGMAAMILVGAARLAVRVHFLGRRDREHYTRVVLYGTGPNAELVLRGLALSPDLEYAVVGLLDDDPRQRGREIRSVRVLGGVEHLEKILRAKAVEEIWISTPDLPGEKLRRIYEIASPQGVRTKILPRLRSALLGEDLGRFQEPDIADLLRRPPRNLDPESMRAWIHGKSVLITGAGGSIGSELARRVATFEPASLAICDASETNLFEIHGELSRERVPGLLPPFLVDVRDRRSVSRMFAEARPEIVFHAAAYKHVPLVELNPCEGVLTNVLGLANVAIAAAELGTRDFVFISTDKAVRPTNVMGATKRLGERIVQTLNAAEETRYCAVRFGNVLGSSGSVVPIFQRQIEAGGPITVTHEDMTRYFMLVSEAVQLVIQAGSFGEGGEIFILDMGEPVRIADMARDLIRLMGKEPDIDVKVVFTGTRPGEKIYEELLIDAKGDSQTKYQDIWIEGQRPAQLPWSELAAELKPLFEAASSGDRARTLRLLAAAVEEFQPLFEETRGAIESAPAIGTDLPDLDAQLESDLEPELETGLERSRALSARGAPFDRLHLEGGALERSPGPSRRAAVE